MFKRLNISMLHNQIKKVNEWEIEKWTTDEINSTFNTSFWGNNKNTKKKRNQFLWWKGINKQTKKKRFRIHSTMNWQSFL